MGKFKAFSLANLYEPEKNLRRTAHLILPLTVSDEEKGYETLTPRRLLSAMTAMDSRPNL
jgi:hypothetical protein